MSLTGVKIILASQSPRRGELLKELVGDFAVVPSGVEETLNPALTPEANALALARDKALWVARRHAGCVVIGADTLVVLDGVIIGKPRDAADARRILKSLCGRRHRVITGVAVAGPAGKLFQEAAVSCVDFKTAADEEIAGYVRTGEPLDKAGAYAIQGKGAFLVHAYEGSYSNIVGLPLETLRNLLRQATGKN